MCTEGIRWWKAGGSNRIDGADWLSDVDFLSSDYCSRKNTQDDGIHRDRMEEFTGLLLAAFWSFPSYCSFIV